MEIKSIASLLQSQPKHNSACVRIRDRPLLGLALWQEKWEPTTSWTYSSALGSLMMPDGGGLPCSQIYRGLEKQFPSTWLCLMSQVSKWNQIALKKKKNAILRGIVLKEDDLYLEAEGICWTKGGESWCRGKRAEMSGCDKGAVGTWTWIQVHQGFSWPSARPQSWQPARTGWRSSRSDIPHPPGTSAGPLSWQMAAGRKNGGWLMDTSNLSQWFSGVFWEENARKIWAFCWFDRLGLGPFLFGDLWGIMDDADRWWQGFVLLTLSPSSIPLMKKKQRWKYHDKATSPNYSAVSEASLT